MFNREKQNEDLSGLHMVGAVEGFSHQHVTAAMVAVVVSLVLHALLLYMLSGVKFGIASILEEKKERMHRAIELTDVQIDEPASSRKGSDASSVSGGMDPDLSKDIDILIKQPDLAALQPSSTENVTLKGEDANIAEPSPVPERTVWQPRQEIMAISKEIAIDEIPSLERQRIPKIERVSSAADIVPPVQWDDALQSSARGASTISTPAGALGVAEISGADIARAVTAPAAAVVINEAAAESGTELFEEKAEEISSFTPVDNVLSAALSIYSSRNDRDFGYFRIDVQRVGADVLPVIPKDLLLVQDCSASMSEQRLYFCREGLRRCLAKVGDADRFNVVGFREKGELCFDGWADNNIDNIVKAEKFVDAMRAGGNTDIYTSLQEILSFERVAGRPMVVLVVTDGLSTAGLTRSSDIIGQFSKSNDGSVSVFTVGTIQRANKYLLDLLSYCNRGGSQVVTGGRWDIPEVIENLASEVGRPVMADVGFRFGADSGCESYPILSENLYLDRPLVIYGRYPKTTSSIAFQAVGQAGSSVCDMVFDLQPERDGKRVDSDIRTEWARQKIYHLIGQYARTSDPDVMREIKRTSREFNVKVPYSGKF